MLQCQIVKTLWVICYIQLKVTKYFIWLPIAKALSFSPLAREQPLGQRSKEWNSTSMHTRVPETLDTCITNGVHGSCNTLHIFKDIQANIFSFGIGSCYGIGIL